MTAAIEALRKRLHAMVDEVMDTAAGPGERRLSASEEGEEAMTPDLATLRRLAEAARDAREAAIEASKDVERFEPLSGGLFVMAEHEAQRKEHRALGAFYAAFGIDPALALLARLERAEAALREQHTWHEAERKALGKQPSRGDLDWRRLQHREQMDLIDAYFASHEKASTP